ncbi:MAG: TetR/AcrR family transcriptional regulator [Acutalibacteraceae bacterium]|nr:TetR/AcrR family transcriptional regulator [Acutalibacteraceae bacterium]
MAKEIYCKPTFNNIPEEKRRKILDVAVMEFANHGFENANINVIAKKAEVSVGSLYKYFDTKTDLFLTSINYGISTLDSIIDAVAASDDDAMAKLERLIRIAIEYSRKSSVLIKLYNEFTGESDPELAKKIASDMEVTTAAAYKKAIIDGQASGEIRTDIDPGMAAFMIDNLLMNIQFSYACDYYRERYKIYAGDDIFQKDEFAVENILRFVKSALKMEKRG